MNSIESNNLIAKFMGLKQNRNPYKSSFVWDRLEDLPELRDVIMNTLEDESWYVFVKFDVSWDWLMPVIDKIESFGYKFEINQGYSYLEHKTGLRYLGEATGKTKLEASYRLVVNFIEWYNKQ